MFGARDLGDLEASPRNKASTESVACVRDMIAHEQQLVRQLDATRDRLRTCLAQARGPRGADQVAWTTIARAVLGRPASVAEIRRLAGTLANRHWRR